MEPATNDHQTVSILGGGWVGLPLGEALASGGHSVRATTTTPERQAPLADAGIEPFLLRLAPDVEMEDAARADGFFDADVLVFTVPPPRETDGRGKPAFYEEQVRAAAEAAGEGGVQHVLYTSSTGVYPPLGRVVTEEDAATTDEEITALKRESGRAVLAAERAWHAAAAEASFDVSIVRLGGLYGPGREPARFLAGRTGLEEGGRPINFVHQDDAVGVLRAVIERAAWGETFNACADEHPSRRDFFRRRAEIAGLEPPTFSDDERGAFKIVSNARVKERLGYSFRHPDPLE